MKNKKRPQNDSGQINEKSSGKKATRMAPKPKKAKYRHMSHWLDEEDYLLPKNDQEE